MMWNQRKQHWTEWKYKIEWNDERWFSFIVFFSFLTIEAVNAVAPTVWMEVVYFHIWTHVEHKTIFFCIWLILFEHRFAAAESCMAIVDYVPSSYEVEAKKKTIILIYTLNKYPTNNNGTINYTDFKSMVFLLN